MPMKSNNRVLLAYPAGKRDDREPDRPPLGLLTVAGPLVEQGMEVCLLDERAEKDFDSRLAEELKKRPICVGISSMSGRHISGAMRISQQIKAQSTIPVVWGGVQASLEPLSTIRHELVDLIVRDDGEETFPHLLAEIQNGCRNLDNIKGIGFIRDGQPVLTESADPAKIEDLPLVPFHLVDFEKYRSTEPWTSERNLLPLETSRGCPFSHFVF